ncbi:MAG: hypothetical protein IJM33_07630 [Bacteroidales bacterium]|nr:hypothetical protein [Bacteroidales bacterium]
MDKKNKLSYEPPKVVAVTFKVEVGQAASQTLAVPPLSTFGSGSWDDPSSSSSTNVFGNRDWSDGSSSSSNSTFGSRSWDD